MHVILPIRIVNLISVDPPASHSFTQESANIISKEQYNAHQLQLLERTGTVHTTKSMQAAGLSQEPFLSDEEATPRTSTATARFDDISGSLYRRRSTSEVSVSVYEDGDEHGEQQQLVRSVLEHRPKSESYTHRDQHSHGHLGSSERPAFNSRPRFELVDPGPGPVRRPTSFQTRVHQKLQAQAPEPAHSVKDMNATNNSNATFLEPYDMPVTNNCPEAPAQPGLRPPSEIRWKTVESLPLPTPPFSRFTTPTTSASSSPTSLIPGAPYKPSHTMPRPPMVMRRTEPSPTSTRLRPEEETYLPRRESETFILPVFSARSDDSRIAQSASNRARSTSTSLDPLIGPGSGFSVKSRIQEVEGKVENLKRRTDGMVSFY